MPYRGRDKRPARKAYRPPKPTNYGTGESRYTQQYAYKYPVANEESRYRGKVITTNYPDERQEAIATQMRIPPPATPGAAWLRNVGGQMGFNTGGRTPYPVLPNAMGAFATRNLNPNVPYMQQSMGYGRGSIVRPTARPTVNTTRAGALAGAGNNNPSYRHGYHQQVISRNIQYGAGNEAQGTTEPLPPAYPETPYDPYGGYGYGYGGGGGGGSYSGYSQPFSQYQRGYAAQGSQAPAAMGMRTAPQAQAYRSNYAVANQQARWLSLLTNWRI